jgi:hypothetical protein
MAQWRGTRTDPCCRSVDMLPYCRYSGTGGTLVSEGKRVFLLLKSLARRNQSAGAGYLELVKTSVPELDGFSCSSHNHVQNREPLSRMNHSVLMIVPHPVQCKLTQSFVGDLVAQMWAQSSPLGPNLLVLNTVAS